MLEEFYIHLTGTWHFNSLILADSREEAVEEAIKVLDRETISLLTLTLINYWLEDEEEEGKMGPRIFPLKSGLINRNHTLN
jgi:hypothetical protein